MIIALLLTTFVAAETRGHTATGLYLLGHEPKARRKNSQPPPMELLQQFLQCKPAFAPSLADYPQFRMALANYCTKQEKILLLFFLSALYQNSRLLFQEDSRTFHTKYYSQFILLKCTNRRYVLVLLLYHIRTYYTRILYSVKETIKRRIACCFAFIVSITVGGLEKWLKSGLRQVS